MAVSNTTPIIYLVKVKRLNLLERVYRKIYVCSAVWQDIIHLQTRGLLTPNEIFSISQARQKWMMLQDPKEKESIEVKDSLIDRGLGLGEAYSIALAKELKTMFLANDKQAIEAARDYGIETRWFTEILHDALKANHLKSVDEYIQTLDACIKMGLYVSRKQRERAIQKAYSLM
ncbi:MAG: hypothetical protein ACQXXG_02160 [Candidatus Bathyarchaeia archaeon]|jgi:predicted nucleic acid-binding protein